MFNRILPIQTYSYFCLTDTTDNVLRVPNQNKFDFDIFFFLENPDPKAMY